MEKNSRLNYGEKLKNARKNRGLTQKVMATFLKISVATIKNIENKNHIPNTEILRGIEKLFPELKNILDEMIVSKNTNMKKEKIISKTKKVDDFEKLKEKVYKLEEENKLLKESKKIEIQKEDLKSFEDILKKFTKTVETIKKSEEKILFAELDEISSFDRTSENGLNERKKILSLKNDYESINRAMKLMWLLNDETNKYFSELNLLLSTNVIESNLKIKKGLSEISKNLIEMGKRLQDYINEDEVIEI